MPINKNKPKKKKVKKVVPNSEQLSSHQRAITEQSGRRVIPKSAKKKRQIKSFSLSPKAKKKPAKSKVSYMNPDGLGKNSPMPKEKKSYMEYKKGGKTEPVKKTKKSKKAVINDGKGVGYRESTPKSRLTKAYKAVENSRAGWLIPGMAANKIKKKLGYKKGGFIQFD